MKQWGVWQNVNYQDALYVRTITSGLTPYIGVNEVPDSVTMEEMEAIVSKSGLDCDEIGYGYHQFQVLPIEDWPPVSGDIHWGFQLTFKVLKECVELAKI